jgi:hypothetical protein
VPHKAAPPKWGAFLLILAAAGTAFFVAASVRGERMPWSSPPDPASLEGTWGGGCFDPDRDPNAARMSYYEITLKAEKGGLRGQEFYSGTWT